MGVYTRFKRDPNGLRSLVELLESTPRKRRDRMIQVGMEEDSEYTERALKYMIQFEDILELSDLELAELIAHAAGRMTGIAISLFDEEIQNRFLRNAPAKRLGEIREYLEHEVSKSEVGSAQIYLVTKVRELEKSGALRVKCIPMGN